MFAPHLDDFLHALLEHAVSGRVGDHKCAEVRRVLLSLTPTSHVGVVKGSRVDGVCDKSRRWVRV